MQGTIRNAKGHLGAFELTVDDFAAPAPSSRGALRVRRVAGRRGLARRHRPRPLGRRAALSRARAARRLCPRRPRATGRRSPRRSGRRPISSASSTSRASSTSLPSSAPIRARASPAARAASSSARPARSPRPATTSPSTPGSAPAAAAAPPPARPAPPPTRSPAPRRCCGGSGRSFAPTSAPAAPLRCVLFHDAGHGEPLIDALARFGAGLPANVLPVGGQRDHPARRRGLDRAGRLGRVGGARARPRPAEARHPGPRPHHRHREPPDRVPRLRPGGLRADRDRRSRRARPALDLVPPGIPSPRPAELPAHGEEARHPREHDDRAAPRRARARRPGGAALGRALRRPRGRRRRLHPLPVLRLGLPHGRALRQRGEARASLRRERLRPVRPLRGDLPRERDHPRPPPRLRRLERAAPGGEGGGALPLHPLRQALRHPEHDRAHRLQPRRPALDVLRRERLPARRGADVRRLPGRRGDDRQARPLRRPHPHARPARPPTTSASAMPRRRNPPHSPGHPARPRGGRRTGEAQILCAYVVHRLCMHCACPFFPRFRTRLAMPPRNDGSRRGRPIARSGALRPSASRDLP